MIRPAIHTMLWKRPEISKLHLDLLAETGYPIFVSLSEPWAEEECKKRGFHYWYGDNSPLGEKKLRGIETAFKHPDWTHMIEMGSDDFFDPDSLLNFIIENQEGRHFFGTDHFYIISEDRRKGLYFKYSLSNKYGVIGAGRVSTRHLLHSLHPLWNPVKERSLDTVSAMKAIEHGYSLDRISTEKPLVVDVKTIQNIWSYSKLYKSPTTKTKEVSLSEALSILPKTYRQKILAT